MKIFCLPLALVADCVANRIGGSSILASQTLRGKPLHEGSPESRPTTLVRPSGTTLDNFAWMGHERTRAPFETFVPPNK